MPNSDQSDVCEAPAADLPKLWWLWSILICLHLTAVLIPPFTFISSSTQALSPLAADARETFLPYTTFLHLNHGYAFFAPDPGPSHLIEYRVEKDDGTVIEQTFPDKKRHWPRLLYHRHFMLSEQLFSDYAPPSIPDSEPDEVRAEWRRRRDRYEAKFESFRRHLVSMYGTEKVTLKMIEHALPSWSDVQNGGLKINDPSLYQTIDEWPVPTDDLEDFLNSSELLQDLPTP
ncbi:MAG: hypothetical protein KDB27_32075 [Planctomycetales bacterium]|nr:hypothetical protein [Planctomycetales bacterium]